MTFPGAAALVSAIVGFTKHVRIVGRAGATLFGAPGIVNRRLTIICGAVGLVPTAVGEQFRSTEAFYFGCHCGVAELRRVFLDETLTKFTRLG